MEFCELKYGWEFEWNVSVCLMFCMRMEWSTNKIVSIFLEHYLDNVKNCRYKFYIYIMLVMLKV